MRRAVWGLLWSAALLRQESRPGSRPAAAPPERKEDEYALKAAALFVLASFIEWPGEVRDRKSFRIGILGEDRFGPKLDASLEGKKLAGRPVAVSRLGTVKDADKRELLDCDVLFVAGSERPSLANLLEAVVGRPTLIVGDSVDFVRAGGMVELYLEDHKIRFEINGSVVSRAGLIASSKLLRLSRPNPESQGLRR